MPRDHELDEILDGALARYSDAAPIAGLEERILARVHGDRRARVSGWAAAIAFAGALLVTIIFVPVRHRDSQFIHVKTSPIALPSAKVNQQLTFVLASRRFRRGTALPKQAVFPAQVPATAEERALLQFANCPVTPFSEGPVTAEPIKVNPVQVSLISTDDSNEKF